MTVKKTIKIVEAHNKWRRGGKGKMGEPRQLGVALEVLLVVAKDYCKIYNMDRVDVKPIKHNSI